MAFYDLSGKTFGRWTVVNYVGNSRWKCKCECGVEREVSSYELRNNKTLSCGCFAKEKASLVHKKHGGTNTRLYRIFYKMKERCYRKNNDNYKWYGGLGITICDEWLNDFQKFQKWSFENGYKENLTIDRIDPTKNYEPHNCRWITIQEQQKNRRKRGEIKWQTLQTL